jgi:hypothetical protein
MLAPAFLFGRRTWHEDVLGYWNTQDSPFKRSSPNQAAKHAPAPAPLTWEVASIPSAHG